MSSAAANKAISEPPVSADTSRARATDSVCVVLSGPSGAGKTTLSRAWSAAGVWPRHAEPTIGVDFVSRTLIVERFGAVPVRVWDTSGQERFHALTPSYYRSADAVLLAFDGSSKASCAEALEPFVREMRSAPPGPSGRDPVVALVVTKADLWCACASSECACGPMAEAREAARAIGAVSVARASREEPLSGREPFRVLAERVCEDRAAAGLRASSSGAAAVSLTKGEGRGAAAAGCCT
jgi:small GTP-binding protein